MLSMTAFSRSERSIDEGTLVWEVKSVNHRYLEPHFRLPELFRELEFKLREVLRKRLGRGKVEVALKWQPAAEDTQDFTVNQVMLNELKHSLDQVHDVFQALVQPTALELLAWPGVLSSTHADFNPIRVAAIDSFNQAIDGLIESRQREGAAIKPLIADRLATITDIVASVRKDMPSIIEHQNTQLKARVEELIETYDEARLETELVILAQKADVAEELDRLDAHVREIGEIIERKEPIGRRLDFLMQELNREANTLSSKAIVLNSTNAAVELKVLIEQIREQIQNVE